MVPRYRTSQFAHPRRFHFSAEASELDRGMRQPLFGLIAHSNTVDEGLILVSSVTGREVRLAVVKKHTLNDEVTHWELTSVPEDTQRLQLSQPFTMVIFND